MRRRRWIRSLASIAGLFLVTSLLSPTSAVASSTGAVAPAVATVEAPVAAMAAVAPAVQAVEAPMAVMAALPQSLPTPVPRMVELQLTLRLLFASLLGAAVGKERSSTHKRSAGVRTMALVALGACAFTVCSAFGFSAAVAGGRCDPSRMASNVASGVGFVGAGVITTTSNNPNDSRQSIVHGLTTATAIWISAAIGVACGVGMLYIATAATLSTITILRFGGFKKKFRKAQDTYGQLFGQDKPWAPRKKNTSSVLSSNTASLEEMTTTADDDDDIDDWDSHVEFVISEDDDDDIVSHSDNNDPTVALPREEMQKLREILNIDHDITEFYIRGQAKILHQAEMAARSKNLTDLVTHNKSPQNNTYAVTEEYVRQLERSHGNGTWTP